jgi:AcrR family transcriptional regulator
VAVTRETSDTRTQILVAAERLFAEQGIGASLREISRAAGQGNTRAAQYHFGDRDGLILAVLEPHRQDTGTRRHALLDEYEQTGVSDGRALAAALVLPLATKLGDASGRRYLQIATEYLLTTPRDEALARQAPDDSILRWHRLLDELTDTRARRDPFQRYAPRVSAVRVVLIALARRAAAATVGETDSGPDVDEELFVSFLTDQAAALLAVTMSTESLAVRRRAAPRRAR